MSLEDLQDSNFLSDKWPHMSAAIDREIVDLTLLINSQFDTVVYAGLGDYQGQEPAWVDLSGFNPGVPSTITLSPTKSISMVVDQFRYEAQQLYGDLACVAEKIRFLAGAAKLEWWRPLKASLVLPPSREELIKWRGRAQGFEFTDHITEPALYVYGRVLCAGVEQ